MSALNSTTIVAPTGPVVHITDLLPRLHKPDEPVSSVGAATIGGFLPATHSTSGVGIVPHAAIPSPLSTPNGPASDGAFNAVVDEGGVVNTVSDAVGSQSSTAALLSHPSSAAAMLNRLMSVSAHLTPAGGAAMPMPGSNGPSNGSSSGRKKCPYHRQCWRSHHHLHQHHLHQQQQQQQQQQTHLQPSGNIQGHPYAAAWNRYRNGGSSVAYPQQRDAISTNVTPPPPNAVLLAGRYLMMEAVEGNNLYHCCDIKTRGELVCKVKEKRPRQPALPPKDEG